VIDRELPVGLADDAFGGDGELADEEQRLALADLLAELVAELEPARVAA
jgi:chromate reductase, NAD(P)H dehydrogenase (quinone)